MHKQAKSNEATILFISDRFNEVTVILNGQRRAGGSGRILKKQINRVLNIIKNEPKSNCKYV